MYVLTRAARRDDPNHLTLHTYDEAVEVRRVGGEMVAHVQSIWARDALRRQGYTLIPLPSAPAPTAQAHPPLEITEDTVPPAPTPKLPEAPQPAEAPDLPLAVLVPVPTERRAPRTEPAPTPEWDARAWATEIGEAAGTPTPLDAATALAFQRGPLDARKPKGGKVPTVDVVLVTTGWGSREKACLRDLVALARAVKVRIVVVENSGTEGLDVDAPESVVVVRTLNRGFSAACNAGLAKVRKTAKAVLFTQSDVEFTVEALADAARLAVASNAVVGPSGGLLHSEGMAKVAEWGRNVGLEDHAPRAVDFVAGYWLVIPTARLAEVGGWDAGFALYYEDPDLCLRLALAGYRSIAWPSLKVDHDRGATIRSRMSDNERERIREVSRARFIARWGGR